MWTKVIAFIGGDKYDLITCFAKELKEMGFRVLMADYTSLQGLMLTIPDYVERQIEEYQGLEYIGNPEKGLIAQLIKEEKYDFILMDYDYVCGRKDILLCQNICFVTDMQRHHLNVLEALNIPEWIEKSLIVKDGATSGQMEHYLNKMAGDMGIENKYFFCWRWGEREHKNQIRCQYQYEIPWKRISASMRKIMQKLIQQWMAQPASDIQTFLQAGGAV